MRMICLTLSFVLSFLSYGSKPNDNAKSQELKINAYFSVLQKLKRTHRKKSHLLFQFEDEYYSFLYDPETDPNKTLKADLIHFGKFFRISGPESEIATIAKPIDLETASLFFSVLKKLREFPDSQFFLQLQSKEIQTEIPRDVQQNRAKIREKQKQEAAVLLQKFQFLTTPLGINTLDMTISKPQVLKVLKLVLQNQALIKQNNLKILITPNETVQPLSSSFKIGDNQYAIRTINGKYYLDDGSTQTRIRKAYAQLLQNVVAKLPFDTNGFWVQISGKNLTTFVDDFHELFENIDQPQLEKDFFSNDKLRINLNKQQLEVFIQNFIKNIEKASEINLKLEVHRVQLLYPMASS